MGGRSGFRLAPEGDARQVTTVGQESDDGKEKRTWLVLVVNGKEKRTRLVLVGKEKRTRLVLVVDELRRPEPADARDRRDERHGPHHV